MKSAAAPPLSLSQTLITGVYRSGTEFVSVLLSGHPQLSSTMYHVNALRFIGTRSALETGDGEAETHALAATLDRLKRRYGLVLNPDDVMARYREIRRRADCPGWAAFYDACVSTLWLTGEKNRWAEKCQLLWREIPDFLAGMPNGRAIMVIRDPRSVTASFKAYTYAPPPAYLGAVFNCLDAMRRAALYQATLPSDRFLLLRWEDAALAPAATAARAFGFLGLDPDEARIDPAAWRDARGERWTANTTAANRGFDIDAAVSRWRDGLDPVDLGFVEAVCGDEMRRFGYPLSGAAVDWAAATDRLRASPQLAEALARWRDGGEGMQAFPADPLDPGNWAENRQSAGQGGGKLGQSANP